MIWQRSVVAKEKVRTIEVNDYSSGNVNANVSLRYFFFVFFLNFICDICSLQ